MYLHISPIDMWNMPWYDIVYLYRAYNKLVSDSKEANDIQGRAEAEAAENQMTDMQNQMHTPQMPTIPDYSSMARDMMDRAMAAVPKMG